ncbi:hypothetical protein ISF_04918 [Cordyceps fumosorosea ARSEF 2679]|uniref:Uncharacterized protein n=1 Tax=Cordyceps fumosorosea (strain ARSEF 2679) TaxID=1081104 RepID=A0A162J2Z2_CORFA|nr:hypothetical protein ISF_04918 [Cordyceps fumosorosea ARSEF 2679]OAA63042.1 hypothetical protein ISF_04918 [Cordyceps fumosorosea ARSEF 2679]
MRNSEKTTAGISLTLARQFAHCYWQPSRAFPLLHKHPHLCDRATRQLLERDAARLLLPGQSSRALNITCAVALLKMCAGRSPAEIRRRMVGLVSRGGAGGTCEETYREHLAQARDIFARVMRTCATERRRREAGQKMPLRRDPDGRRDDARVNVKACRRGGGGGVELSLDDHDHDHDHDHLDGVLVLLETIPFEEASHALRGMSVVEREAALDRMTQVRFDGVLRPS